MDQKENKYIYLNDFENKILNKLLQDNKDSLIQNKEYISNNILVSSRFGCGKTTLKNEIINKYKTEKNFFIVDIDLLNNYHNSPIEMILISIVKSIDENNLKDNEVIIEKIIEDFGSKIKEIPWIKYLLNLGKDRNNFGTTQLLNKLKEKYEINFFITNILMKLNNKNKKIIFLFDELDRCNNKFIQIFFNDIKNIMNIENVINIVFANKYYINELFPKLSNDEDYTSKYFNYNYELPSDHLSYIQNNFINQFNVNLDIINYKNNNLKIFKSINSIPSLFKDKLSFRYIIKNLNLINNFINNIQFIIKNSPIIQPMYINNNEFTKMFDLYYKNFEWIIIPLFLILKGNSYINLESLRDFLKENNLNIYFEKEKIISFIDEIFLLFEKLSNNKVFRLEKYEKETLYFIYDELIGKGVEDTIIFSIELYLHIIIRLFFENNSIHNLYKIDDFSKSHILEEFKKLKNLNYFLDFANKEINNEK